MPQLDGLRGLCVMAVLYAHFMPKAYWPLGIYLGGPAVQCFFVLSGFLITSILLHEMKECPSLKRFAAHFLCRRALRLMPALFLCLAVAYLLNIQAVRETIWWHLAYLSNFYFVGKGAWDGPVSHLWSLAAEEQFYVIWPFFLFFVPRRYLEISVTLIVLFAVTFRLVWWHFGLWVNGAWILPPGPFEGIGVGALVALWVEQGVAGPRLRVAALCGVILLICSLLVQWPAVKLSLGSIALALCFAWAVLSASSGFGGFLGYFLETTPLIYIGKISYGIYVLHLFVQDYLSRWVEAPAVVFSLLAAVATISLAAASWHFIERPIRTAGQWLLMPAPVIARA